MKKSSLLLGLFVLITFVVASPLFAFDNVTPAVAYEMAEDDDDVYILDVRTPEEWKWVGHPGENRLCLEFDDDDNVCEEYEGTEIKDKVKNIPILIMKDGAMTLNPSFLTDVNEAFDDDDADDVVIITMCRSGSRSKLAAGILEDAGYEAINMEQGFEGGRTERGYRLKNGWINTPHPEYDDPSIPLPYTK